MVKSRGRYYDVLLRGSLMAIVYIYIKSYKDNKVEFINERNVYI